MAWMSREFNSPWVHQTGNCKQEAVLKGRKQFELRLANFKYKPGDTLVLLEQKKDKKELSGRKLECEVLFTINTKIAEKFWSKKQINKYGLAVISLRRKFRFR